MGLSITPIIDLDEFNSVGYQDTHVKTQVELRRKSSGVIVHTWNTSSNQNSFTLPSGMELDHDTEYEVRARREGEVLGWSNWSEWSTFTTERNIGQLASGEIGPFEYNGRQYYVAPASTRVRRLWKTSSTSTAGTWSYNDGWINTNSMNNRDHPAAQYTRNLGSGWYLPAIDELNRVVYQNRVAIDAVDTTNGTKLSNMGKAWSSTESSSFYGIYLWLSSGNTGTSYKAFEEWVVAVRRA